MNESIEVITGELENECKDLADYAKYLEENCIGLKKALEYEKIKSNNLEIKVKELKNKLKRSKNGCKKSDNVNKSC